MNFLGFEPAVMDTPIFDFVHEDHAGAAAKGVEWHPHWRLQASWDEWAEYEHRDELPF